jgi:hypothetical protein
VGAGHTTPVEGIRGNHKAPAAHTHPKWAMCWVSVIGNPNKNHDFEPETTGLSKEGRSATWRRKFNAQTKFGLVKFAPKHIEFRTYIHTFRERKSHFHNRLCYEDCFYQQLY